MSIMYDHHEELEPRHYDKECSICGARYETLRSVDGEYICEDCYPEYALRDDVIEQNFNDYISDDESRFFKSWFWDGDIYLDDSEKLDIMKAAFKALWERDQELAKLAIREFIEHEGGDWTEFVKDHDGGVNIENFL